MVRYVTGTIEKVRYVTVFVKEFLFLIGFI